MQKVDIQSGTVSITANKITILDIKGGREVTHIDVQELYIECNKFTNRTGPLLINIPADVSVSFQALKESAKDDGTPNIAFVTKTKTTHMMAKTIFSIISSFGSDRNMRAFMSRTEAEEWLMNL